MSDVKYNLNYKFGADLKPIPDDRKSMQAYVEFLKDTLKKIKSGQKETLRAEIKLLGEIGSHAIMLGDLDLALLCLGQSLKLIDEHAVGIRTWAVHTIRFADAHRMKKEFLDAETGFRSVLEMAERHPELKEVEDFAWQHLGKLKFDEGDMKAATDCLNRALELRKKKGIKELIDSTEFALNIIRSKNSLLKKYK